MCVCVLEFVCMCDVCFCVCLCVYVVRVCVCLSLCVVCVLSQCVRLCVCVCVCMLEFVCMCVVLILILIQILFNLGKPLAMRLLFKAPRLQYRQTSYTHTQHITQSNQFVNQSAVLMVGGCHFFPLLLEVSPCHPISVDLQS